MPGTGVALGLNVAPGVALLCFWLRDRAMKTTFSAVSTNVPGAHSSASPERKRRVRRMDAPNNAHQCLAGSGLPQCQSRLSQTLDGQGPDQTTNDAPGKGMTWVERASGREILSE